ncbi:isocitrate lyase/PEP mutase family protein [Nannocystaceae bacterium ST9]
MTTTIDKRADFRRLHERGCFVMPNPWDVGSARFLAQAGFPALATTSAGLAFSLGLPDRVGVIPLAALLAHVEALVAATDLPINADFQAGYADDPEGVAINVRACVATGVAGLSIEDASGDPNQPLFTIADASARIRAARAAIDEAGGDVILTGRAECFLVGQPDLDEVIRRLRAYADAGADCLYAPGITTRTQIAALVDALAPRPINLLIARPSELEVDDIAALGVRRISLGSALARVAWGAFMRAARAIADRGSFERLGEATPFAELDALFE